MCFSALVAAFMTNSNPYYVQERPPKVLLMPTFPREEKSIRGKQRDILVNLMERPMTVTEIARAVGISTTAVSHNLRKLEEMRLVSFKEAGRAKKAELTEHGLWWAWMIREKVI